VDTHLKEKVRREGVHEELELSGSTTGTLRVLVHAEQSPGTADSGVGYVDVSNVVNEIDNQSGKKSSSPVKPSAVMLTLANNTDPAKAKAKRVHVKNQAAGNNNKKSYKPGSEYIAFEEFSSPSSAKEFSYDVSTVDSREGNQYPLYAQVSRRARPRSSHSNVTTEDGWEGGVRVPGYEQEYQGGRGGARSEQSDSLNEEYCNQVVDEAFGAIENPSFSASSTYLVADEAPAQTYVTGEGLTVF